MELKQDGYQLILFMSPALSFDAELIGPWVFNKLGSEWIKNRGRAIGQIRNGQITSGIVYEDWNGPNIVCHIAGDPGWANRKFLHIIADYPFNQIGVRRITAPVASSNLASLEMVNKMGFFREAVLHGAHPDGDLYLFCLYPENYRFWRK